MATKKKKFNRDEEMTDGMYRALKEAKMDERSNYWKKRMSEFLEKKERDKKAIEQLSGIEREVQKTKRVYYGFLLFVTLTILLTLLSFTKEYHKYEKRILEVIYIGDTELSNVKNIKTVGDNILLCDQKDGYVTSMHYEPDYAINVGDAITTNCKFTRYKLFWLFDCWTDIATRTYDIKINSKGSN